MVLSCFFKIIIIIILVLKCTNLQIGEHYLTNESIERIAMHYRQFFHSQTGEALNPEDEKQLIDSDDEVDEDWIHTKSAEVNFVKANS